MKIYQESTFSDLDLLFQAPKKGIWELKEKYRDMETEDNKS